MEMDKIKKLFVINNKLLTYLLLDLEEEDEKTKRQYRVRPYLKERIVKGRFSTDFDNLANDPKNFYKNFHMSVESFNKLYELVYHYLLPKKTCRPDIIWPKEKLAITLEFLASGDLQRHISSCYRISDQCFSKILDTVCDALIKVLAGEIPKWTQETMVEIAMGFEKRWDFPNCVGAIDGKHVSIQSPPNSGSLFYNYKGYFSIVILAVCDSSYRFTYLDIGGFGSEGDANIFRKTEFGKSVLQDTFPFPSDADVNGTKLPLFLVGDDAFPLCKRMMKPYSGRNLSKEQKIFNYRLSRARRCIENAFGIVAWKFPCLQKKLFCSPEHAQKIATTSCLLHNFLLKKENESYLAGSVIGENNILSVPDKERNELGSSLLSCGGRHTDTGKLIRDNLLKHFNSASGAVPWQDEAAFL